MWDIRESRERVGWWDIISVNSPDWVYCSAPEKNRAWFIAQLLNGGIQMTARG
jgi:hypothetical protein